MIINLTEKELEESANMFQKVFTSAPFNFQWLTKKASFNYLKDIINDSNYRGFVYKYDGVNIGYCFGNYNKHLLVTQYHIKEIFINTNLQRNGHGKRMMLEIEEILKKDKVNTITLYTNLNIPAYEFYLQNNFSVINDTVHMMKVL